MRSELLRKGWRTTISFNSGFQRRIRLILCGLCFIVGLHDYCKQLTNKGAYFLMTNSDTPFVRSYYGGYNMKAIDVARRINRNGGGRKGVDLLITNY